MFMMILTIAGGGFLLAVLGFVIWVAAFRRDDDAWSTAD